MSASIINLPDALRSKTQWLAHFAAHRHPNPGAWYRFSPDRHNYLEGELQPDNSILYHCTAHPEAQLLLSDLRLDDLADFDWGSETKLRSDVQERYTEVLNISAGVVYDDNVSHTFSKTKDLHEQAKVGAEAAFKTYAEVGGQAMGGKAGAEAAAKVSAEYGRNWGEATTTADTISRHVNITGPWKGVYEAVRSVDKMRRTIRTRAVFEAGISMRDGGREICGWQSFAEFLAVAQGLAPNDRALYREFMAHRLVAAEIRAMHSYKPPLVEWTVDYDNVLFQRIDVLRKQ